MLFVNSLTEAEEMTLEAMRNHHPLPITRKRAHSILLSNKGYRVPEIVRIVGGCRQSVSRWLKMWDDIGIIGLIERHRSGRPRKLNAIQEKEAIEKIKENPRSIKSVLSQIADNTGVSICKETLRRICKKSGLKWKRIKKTLKHNRDEKSYQECVEMIAQLLRQFQKNKIPKITTLLYAYKSYVTNCLLTQSRRAAENERRLIKGVGILIFWSYPISLLNINN